MVIIIAHPNVERNIDTEFNKISKYIQKVEDLLEKKLLKLKGFDIEQNIRLESIIKIEVEILENLNFFNFPPLIDIYKKYLNDKLIDSE